MNAEDAIDDETLRLRAIYAAEMPDKVSQLGRHVADLRRDKSDSVSVNELFRAAHSMKGAAGMYGFQNLADLGEAMDEVLYPIMRKSGPATDEICDLCGEWLVAVSDVVASCSNGVEHAAADYAVFHRLRALANGGGARSALA